MPNPQRNWAWAGACLLASWPHPEGAWQPVEGVCWVLCLCVWAQLLRQCLQGAVAIGERPDKRCCWLSPTTTNGCRVLSCGTGVLGEQSSPQRAVGVLYRHRSLVGPLLRWGTVWGPGRTGSSASGTKVLLRAGLATAAPLARPGVGGLLGNHLCLQPPLLLWAARWVPLTQRPPALQGHRPEEAAGPAPALLQGLLQLTEEMVPASMALPPSLLAPSSSP